MLPAKRRILFLAGWRARGPETILRAASARDSRPKAPAPPGGEEPQMFNLGLVPPQQKMTPSDFRV